MMGRRSPRRRPLRPGYPCRSVPRRPRCRSRTHWPGWIEMLPMNARARTPMGQAQPSWACSILPTETRVSRPDRLAAAEGRVANERSALPKKILLLEGGLLFPHRSAKRRLAAQVLHERLPGRIQTHHPGQARIGLVGIHDENVMMFAQIKRKKGKQCAFAAAAFPQKRIFGIFSPHRITGFLFLSIAWAGSWIAKFDAFCRNLRLLPGKEAQDMIAPPDGMRHRWASRSSRPSKRSAAQSHG